jgi:hypothetical protein
MKFKLNRNYVLTTDSGLSFHFEKDKEVHIPPKFAQLAINIGAEPVEAKDKAEAERIQRETDAETAAATERDRKLVDAVNLIIERNDSGDFTAGGRPNMKTISRLVGFAVEKDELDRVFDKIRALRETEGA